MGDYLNMLHNDKADPTAGTVPNENYGREAMQLFSIGLKKLNPDGSLLLDSNALPIATYGQTEVEGFSRVYTGWTFAQNGGRSWDYVSSNYRQPMALVPDHHDQEAKHLLDGVVLPAGPIGHARPQGRAGHARQSSERRAVLLPATHPEARDEQPQPGLRLPRRAGVRQQRLRACAATCARSCAPSCSTTRRAPPRC